MESINCRQCGLVNWPDEETISCKRCGGPIWRKNDYGAGFTFDGNRDRSLFSGIIKFLTIVLGVAVFGFLLGIGLHSVNANVGVLIGLLFIAVGAAFAIAMNFWLLGAIFGESVGWGIATLFLPFAGLVALIKFWDKTQRPFFAHLICLGIILVGYLCLALVMP